MLASATAKHILVHITCACLRRLHGGLDLLPKVRCLVQVLIHCLLCLGEGSLRRLSHVFRYADVIGFLALLQ
jgi:hypothetical protein